MNNNFKYFIGLIFIFLIVISLEHFKQYPKGYWIAFLLVFSLIIRNSKIVHINANEFEARATAFNNLIDKLVEKSESKIIFECRFSLIDPFDD